MLSHCWEQAPVSAGGGLLFSHSCAFSVPVLHSRPLDLPRADPLEKCPECGATNSQERVELIVEPVYGRKVTYGSRYSMCNKCKVTWYNREQMAEQMIRRHGACGFGSVHALRMADPGFRKLFFAGSLYPKEYSQ